MSKRKSSDTSCGNPVFGKATLFICSYAGGGQSSSLLPQVLCKRILYSSLPRDTAAFYVPTTNVHALPSNCSGVLVTLTLEHAKEQNELTVTDASWSLGIIISHDAWNTVVHEVFPIAGNTKVSILPLICPIININPYRLTHLSLFRNFNTRLGHRSSS